MRRRLVTNSMKGRGLLADVKTPNGLVIKKVEQQGGDFRVGLYRPVEHDPEEREFARLNCLVLGPSLGIWQDSEERYTDNSLVSVIQFFDGLYARELGEINRRQRLVEPDDVREYLDSAWQDVVERFGNESD